ncbi:hypothetical protein RchiOBHm_Chr1g0368941 [Rosa chinensis]|uniref:Uncharacterized protein n=1 Tax=Rosa chinensis TaxID=74649 RepID=A0A2P6SKY5_ROSCH|nr:hypothetical protein RchiOBHm_Chr1g0368941 [Rosa chinensis]
MLLKASAGFSTVEGVTVQLHHTAIKPLSSILKSEASSAAQ